MFCGKWHIVICYCVGMGIKTKEQLFFCFFQYHDVIVICHCIVMVYRKNCFTKTNGILLRKSISECSAVKWRNVIVIAWWCDTITTGGIIVFFKDKIQNQLPVFSAVKWRNFICHRIGGWYSITGFVFLLR
jgi:hypothetical protein